MREFSTCGRTPRRQTRNQRARTCTGCKHRAGDGARCSGKCGAAKRACALLQHVFACAQSSTPHEPRGKRAQRHNGAHRGRQRAHRACLPVCVTDSTGQHMHRSAHEQMPARFHCQEKEACGSAPRADWSAIYSPNERTRAPPLVLPSLCAVDIPQSGGMWCWRALHSRSALGMGLAWTLLFVSG